MDSDRWQRVQALFQHAVPLGPAARTAFLAQECGADAELRTQVEALLAQDASDDDVVGHSIEQAARRLLDNEHAAMAGKRFGAWRICKEIARGGMGAVYLAERADAQFEQIAALKLLNPALMAREVLQRFHDERQILARLSHPGIARLIDGGTSADGVPFLAMEFVDGVPIDVYCREHRLDIAARLRLVQKVCRAVEYAHRNLIVHRDIKPSNILVDGSGEPKLLDFGVAKLIDRDQYQNPAAVTVAELRAMTPRYASPEQIKGEPITTATDVYSLGVLLYELLAGRFPYRSASTSAELERAICEIDPERPSTAVTRDDARSDQPLPPARVSRMLAGDLDKIVLMALRKEPGRRYASALQLTEDIDHYLRDEPVLAQPNRWWYRARKFVVRYRVGALATAGVMALIVTIVVFYTQQLATQRDAARIEAHKAADVSRFLTELFRAADPNQALGKEVTARVLLERGAERVALELENAPQVQAALMRAIGESYSNMAEYPMALKQIEGALGIERRQSGADAPAVYELRTLRAGLLSELGRYDEAASEFDAVRAHFVSVGGEHSREAALITRQLGHLAYVRGEYQQSIARYREALADLRKAGPEARADLAKALDDYALALRNMSRLDDASSALSESLALKLDVFGTTHPQVAAAYSSLGNLYGAKGDQVQAVRYLEKAIALGGKLFGEQSLQVARYRANLGNAQYYGGSYAASERNSRAALAVFRRVLGEDHPHVAFLMDNLANALMGEKRPEEALAIYEDSVERLRRTFGEDHIEVARSRTNIAGAMIDLGRFEEARKTLLLAMPVLRTQFGDGQVEMLRWQAKLAETAAGLGKYAEAEAQFGKVIDGYRTLYKDEPSSDIARAHDNLGSIYLKNGKYDEAVATLRQALADWNAFGDFKDDSGIADLHAELGRALLAKRQPAEAVRELSIAYRWQAEHLGKDDPLAIRTQDELRAAQRAARK